MSALDDIFLGLDEVFLACQESTVAQARAELAQLRATIKQFRDLLVMNNAVDAKDLAGVIASQAQRITQLEQAVNEARSKLRATQRNWDEDCLFEYDDILSRAIGDKVEAQP